MVALLIKSTWVYAIIFSLALSAPASSQSPTALAPPRIEIQGCRIKFIDEARLSCERGGILAEIVPVGTYLPAGADVARLRDSVLRARLAIAERDATNDVEVRFARKAAELAQLKYERAQVANRAMVGTVSELELRELRLAAEKAHLLSEQADHRLAVAQLRRDETNANLSSLHISAPFGGFVRSVYKKPGEVVREGELVAEIVNTGRIRVDAFLPLKDLCYVTPGQSVQLFIETPDAARTGRPSVVEGVVSFVDVKVEPVSQTVRVSVDSANPHGQLRDGLTATLVVAGGPSDTLHR